MKKIASNRNYRLIKKADENVQWMTTQIYNCLKEVDPDLDTEHTPGSNEVIIEKEHGKFKITVTRVQAAPTAPTAPTEDEWQPW